MPVIIYCIAISSNNIYSVRYPINLTDFPKLKKCSFWSIFERFIQLGKHVKIAINISITGAFG